jgi:NADPH:quinone reductase-like Zn-dependent oxidoreductase
MAFMKVFISGTAKGIESLEIQEAADPGAIGPGQVRITMRAASINNRDLMAVSGALGTPGSEGLIPCSDGAGEVTEVASDVSQIKVGDRVALTFDPAWIGGPFRASGGPFGRGNARAGVMREEIVVHHSEAVVLPAHLSFEEGACFPCAGVTAWHALCGPSPLYPGMSVLLQGGGGVSVFALQFAALFGARIIMLSSGPERCAQLSELGADETINYRTEPDWNKAVRALTNGQGVDLTIDIGGADTVERSLASTRNGGRLALVGLLGGWPSLTSSLLTAGVDITPIKVGSRTDFEAMNRAVAFHQLRPIIARRYRFEQLPEALRYLQTGRQLGKIVIGFD